MATGEQRRARALLAAIVTLLVVGAVLVWTVFQPATGHAAPRVPVPALAPAHGPHPPAAVNLDGAWQFHPDPALDGALLGWARGATGAGWQTEMVPGVYNPNPLPQFFKGSVGWYRTTFTTPSAPSGFGWALSFGQVRREAQVWLNGVQIGVNSDPYVAFTLPARALASVGQSNTLVVRVDNRKGLEPREGWWNWGGITRPVQLVPQGPVVLQNPGLMPLLRCTAPDRCSAAVQFDGWLANNSSVPLHPEVAVSLTPPGAGPASVAHASTGTIAPGQTRRLRFGFPVRGTPQLWAPGHPSLYDAQIVTREGNLTAQAQQLRIGLRSVTVRHGELLLNDRPVQLSGASIEEDVPGRGPALTGADMDQIVAELQALHANVTRAQYPLSPQLLDRLDAAGIMVWSQAPIYHRDELLVTPAERTAALGTLRGTVLSDRDHPSVITHSVANELTPVPDTTPTTKAYLDDSISVVKDLDTSVPVSLDLLSYPGYPAQATYRRFPLLGVNNYFGWYSSRPPHSTASIAELGPYLRSMHAAYPGQALVMTEFGSEATVAGPVSELHSYAFQQQYITRTLGIVDKLGFMDGSIYWTLREFAVKPHWVGGPGGPGVLGDSIHHKGLITYAGVRKPAFATLAAIFASTPLYRSPPGPVSTPSGTPVLPVLGISSLLLALLALIGVQLWAFVGIRNPGRPRPWPGRVLRLRQDEPAPERVSV